MFKFAKLTAMQEPGFAGFAGGANGAREFRKYLWKRLPKRIFLTFRNLVNFKKSKSRMWQTVDAKRI